VRGGEDPRLPRTAGEHATVAEVDVSGCRSVALQS
jgi:hypothetical protein